MARPGFKPATFLGF